MQVFGENVFRRQDALQYGVCARTPGKC
jgi:hypothetical protein